nr:retrovirus-related Pol polyprotein from transposon TNT 1-94 [Tanacetum cinerariifolium]
MKKLLLRFAYVPGTTMNDHITSFNQLVTDLMNMYEVFKDQDLALILLGSLPEEYELLETTLLNGKDDVSLIKVCAALYCKELRRKDKQISLSRDAEVLLVRGHSQKKGTDKRWRSKSRQRLSKDECAFCHEKGHWKRDCPRLKTKDNHYKGKSVAEANVTKCDNKELDLSLATSSSRNASETWLLDSVYETPLTTHGVGFVRLQNDNGIIMTLKGVCYLPKLKKNLISVGTLESKGFEKRAKDGVMKIISGVLVVMKGICKINNTYHYKGRTIVGTVAAIIDGDRKSEAMKLWHMRLGHAREKSLNLLIKQGLLKGLSSYKVWVYTLKIKDEVLGVFIKWKKMMENQTCKKIKHLQTDNGMVYKIDLFTKSYEDEGIVRHFTIRHIPKHNGVAERMNRTLLEKVWCMLSNAGLGKQLWAEAVTYACYLESKLYPKAKKALFKEITFGIKSYRLWCPETKKMIFSRDVTFNESTMLKRILLALVAQLDLELVQMDVKTASLHGNLEEEIYMVQPEGFKVAGKEHEVYDMLIASQSLDDIEMLKTRLKSEFEVEDLGEVMMILGLVFEHKSSQWVAGYCDFDYAGDLDKRRSTTGYVFTLAKALIIWKSTLQSTTALSTMEAEYMAMTEAIKETI